MGKSYLSYAVTIILQTLANGYQYGFDIMDVTGLPSGTVYPALRRLEDLGFVEMGEARNRTTRSSAAAKVLRTHTRR